MRIQRIFKSIIIIVTVFFEVCKAQSSLTPTSLSSPNKTEIEMWKAATINLECAGSDLSSQELLEIQDSELDKMKRGESIDINNILVGREKRSLGTALFVEYKKKRFLITARHVLHDTTDERQFINETVVNFDLTNKPISDPAIQSIYKSGETIISKIIFRVRNLDEILNKKPLDPFGNSLMNLGAGVYELNSYTFSDPVLDLAVISLSRHKNFNEGLELAGFKPVIIDSLDYGTLTEGTELFCIGYQASTSLLTRLDQKVEMKFWSSDFVSLPTISFGRIAMSHAALPFYWCDLSSYPGDSGGPVIGMNKLIGIITAQAQTEGQRIPFAFVVKSEFVLELLEKQLQKDMEYDKLKK